MAPQPQVDWSTAKPITPEVDWGTAAPINPPTPKPPSLMQQIGQGIKGMQSDIDQTLSAPAQDTGWRGDVERIGQATAQGLTAPFVHPIQTVKGMAEGALPGLPYLMSGAKPEQSGESYGKEIAANPRQGLEHLGGNILGTALLGPLAKGVGETAGMAKSALSPYESPALPPGTRAFQNLALKLGPESLSQGGKSIPGLAEDLMSEHPTISRFARESGIPLKTPEEYGLAAKGARGQITSKFYDELQKPYEGDRLSVSPDVAQFKIPGSNHPLGAYPTVGELNDALNAANEQAGPIHQDSANAFDRAQVMAAENTARQIRQLLNEHLASKSGMTPEDVGSLRERGGKLKNIAENAEARAWSNRMTGRSMLPGGQVIDRPIHSILLRAGQSLLGGQEGFANRGFRGALSKVPLGSEPPTPQMQLQPPGGVTPPAWFSAPSMTAGPEPMSPPGVRTPPGAPQVSAPPIRMAPATRGASAPPIRWSEEEPRPEVPPPPIKYGPKSPHYAAPPIRKWGKE